MATSTIKKPDVYGTPEQIGGITIYRVGKLRTIFVTLPAADIVTLSSSDRPMGDIRVYTKIYDGTNYVDCCLTVTSAGLVCIRDLFGGEIANAQYGFLVTRMVTYITE